MINNKRQCYTIKNGKTPDKKTQLNSEYNCSHYQKCLSLSQFHNLSAEDISTCVFPTCVPNHSLPVFFFQFDRFISSKEIHPSNSGKPFTFLCDGQLHLRLCLHPEACRKNKMLPPYYTKFMDIRKHFKKFYKVEVVNCIKDMLDCILFYSVCEKF